MRVFVDLSESELAALDELAHASSVSRYSLIRQAVTNLLPDRPSTPPADAFGLWGTSVIDGMEYQDALRREW